jgi:hypothetical protein
MGYINKLLTLVFLQIDGFSMLFLLFDDGNMYGNAHLFIRQMTDKIPSFI